MKRAVIFYNGDLSDLQKIKTHIKPTDYVICADGGAKHALEIGVTPDVIIGDFDSLPMQEQNKFDKQKTNFITFKREKDETDSELAVKYALEKNYKTLLLFGVLGSRIDHMLTNIFALDYLTNPDADVTIIEGNQDIRVVHDKIKLTGKTGDLVSLIPLKGDVKKIKTTNLKYPLNNETLKFGYSRGISNVFLKNFISISLQGGSLLVIHTKS